MARKKNKGGDALLGILIVLFIFVILVILLTPIALFLSWLYNLIDYHKNYRNKLKNRFWLNEVQKENFKILVKNLDFAIDKVQNAETLGNKEGLSKNQDGQFSVRSNRGKEIRAVIDKYQNLIYEQQPKFNVLQSLPEKNWKNFRKTYSRLVGFSLSIIAWGSATFIYIKANFEIFNEGLKDYFRFPLKIYEGFTNPEIAPIDAVSIDEWKGLLSVVGVSIGIYFIGWIIGRIISNTKCKRPPLVSLENVDIYSTNASA